MTILFRTLALGIFLSSGSLVLLGDDSKPSTVVATEALSENEKKFAELLTGADLVGSFTVEGKEANPKQDRYSITKAVKVRDNTWMIHARIKYGEVDLTVPVPVQVDWAKDTPVLAVTDLKIPGLGSEFGSRILFHGTLYAGTWQHGKVGGHMWGHLERTLPVPAK